MDRLGLWGGDACPFASFRSFLTEVDKRGVGMMELVAMHLKQRGALVCRDTLVGRDTLVPFATFGEGAPVNWRRRWLRVARAPAPDGVDGHKRRGGKEDDEAVALDIALPDQPRDDAPVILVLHGLNGGSDEPYVRDLAQAAHERGSVCACLVARGLMATPVRASLFHGGRTSDVGACVSVLKACFGDRSALIGISMGGIVALKLLASCTCESALHSRDSELARTSCACERRRPVWAAIGHDSAERLARRKARRSW